MLTGENQDRHRGNESNKDRRCQATRLNTAKKLIVRHAHTTGQYGMHFCKANSAGTRAVVRSGSRRQRLLSHIVFGLGETVIG